MFHFLSKFLPILVYPLGLACIVLVVILVINRESPWTKRLSLIAFLLLFTGGNGFVSNGILYSLENQVPPLTSTPSADVIVVLGGGVRFASPPRLHHEVSDAGDRVLYAARLYHAGAAPVILVSGGRSKWSGPVIGSEAEAMSDILQLAGVPESAIILEIESTNTYENSVKTAEILESMDINQIILVTSAFHMPRSLKIFEKYQLTITPAPTNFHVIDQDWVYMTQLDPRIQLMNLIPTASNLKNTTLALKEYVGIFVYRLRGWL